MTTDYKVTELFYIIDEFCKHLAHPTNPVECCADANPKTMLPNDT